MAAPGWTPTGVTRDDWESLFAELVVGQRLASTPEWDLRFPGEETSFWSRSTLGMGAYLGAGGDPVVRFGGHEADVRECFILGADRMLTNPQGPRWVGSGAGKRLLNVEATYVAIGFWVGRQQLEASPLWTVERQRRWTEEMCAQIHVHPNTNYRTFDLAQMAAMRALGWRAFTDDDYVDDWEHIDREYVGNGFWNDQPNEWHCDAYSAMMVMFLHYFRLMNRSAGSSFESAAIVGRIGDHFDHWRLLPNADGVVVPWGRSAHPAYHQHSALFAIGVDHYDFEPAGEAKRITNLWLQHVRQHAVDPRDHFVRRVERPSASFESQDDYSRASLATGSAIDHAGIVLAAGPAFWEAEEAPLAAERGDAADAGSRRAGGFVAVWPETGYGLAGDAQDGRVIVVPTRTWSDRVNSNCDTKYSYRVLHTDFAQSTGRTRVAEAQIPLLYGQPWLEIAGEELPATILAPAFSFVAPGARALLAGVAGEAVFPVVAGTAVEQRPAGTRLALFSLVSGRDVVHVVRAAAGSRPVSAAWEYTLPVPCEPDETPERRQGEGWATLGHGQLRQLARLVAASGEGHLEAGARFGAAEEQLNRRAADARAIRCRVEAGGRPELTYVLHANYAVGARDETPEQLTTLVAADRLDADAIEVRLGDEHAVVAPLGLARVACGDYVATAPTSSVFAFSCLAGERAFGGGNCAAVSRAGEELLRLAQPGPVAVRQEADHTLVRLAGQATLGPAALPSGAARVLARTPSGGWEDVSAAARFGERGLTLPLTLVRRWRRGLATFRVER